MLSGGRPELGGRDADGLAELLSVVDAAVEQHDIAVGDPQGLALEDVLRGQDMEARHEGGVAVQQTVLPIGPVGREQVCEPLDLQRRNGRPI